MNANFLIEEILSVLLVPRIVHTVGVDLMDGGNETAHRLLTVALRIMVQLENNSAPINHIEPV